MATHSRILAWKIPWTEEPGGHSPWGCKELDTTEQLSTHEHEHHTHKTDIITEVSGSKSKETYAPNGIIYTKKAHPPNQDLIPHLITVSASPRNATLLSQSGIS